MEGIVFTGPGAEKTALLRRQCAKLLEGAGAGRGMLILVRDGHRLSEWAESLRHIYAVEPRVCTFHGFVRQELEAYYPLAAEGCERLPKTEIRPDFLDRDAAVDLVSKVVQYRREKDGIFSAVSSTSEKIAFDILNSLDAAAIAGIPHDKAFTRLYDSLEVKNRDRADIYRAAGDIACGYRKKCLELAALDNSAAVELYCGRLMTNEKYRELLAEKTKYFIADDIQDWDEAQLTVAELLMPGLKGFAFGFDPMAAGGRVNRLRRNELIEKRLLARYDITTVEAKENGEEEGGLPEILFNAIAAGETEEDAGGCESGKPDGAVRGPEVEIHAAVELRSEMLELLGGRVCELIDSEGFKPSDIVILSTYADIVTELVLAGILEKRGYGLINLAARERAADSRLCRAMLALAALCRPHFGIRPSRDDTKLMLELLFGLDPVKSSILAGKICNTIPYAGMPGIEWSQLSEILGEDRLEKYMRVKDWINGCREAPEEDMDALLQKAFLEFFLELSENEEETVRGKLLIDEAAGFCKAVSRFGRNGSRDFLGLTGYGINIANGLARGIENIGEKDVILATPSIYLQAGVKNKVTVICGLSSSNWSPARVRELVNPDVLSAAWRPDEVYTASREESDRRLYLADIMRAVARNCGERLITFESRFSADGYENNGILPEIFEKIL